MIEVERHHDTVDLIRELVGVDIRVEMALVHRNEDCCGQGVDPLTLSGLQRIAKLSGPVVELERRCHEGASAGPQTLPHQPPFEEGPDPGLATRLAQGGGDHCFDEVGGSGPEDLELEVFLGIEVCEEPAFRHIGRFGQLADRKTLDADRAHEVQGLIQNPFFGVLSLGHVK